MKYAIFAIILSVAVAGCRGKDASATAAAAEAKDSALWSALGMVRSQMELFKVQHLEKYPQSIPSVGFNSSNVIRIMNSRSNAQGEIMPVDGKAADYPYGPYLQEFPANPFIDGNGSDPRGISFGSSDPASGDGRTGWYVNTTTGKFSANDDKGRYPAHVKY
jgi:hypothetical protein